MATTSSATKAKPDNQNLTRTKSLGRKPKLPSSTGSSEDGSDQKPEKPLPNYLKPTISSRPDPVKLLKKNNSSLDDNQKLLRRRSFDRPPSSLTSPSTSASPRIQKSLNVSPSRSRDRPAVPREKPVTAQRSSSFHGSRGVPRGGTTVKSPSVAPKKSGLSSSSTSSKSKREGSENVTNKKASDKEINALDSASMSSAQEDHQEEILKVESDHVQVADHNIEEPKDEKEDKEVQETVVQANESVEEKTKSGEPTPVASPIGKDCNAVIKELEEKMINNEEEIEEKIEETKEQDNNRDNKGEEEEDVKKKIDENETPEKVDIESKKAESVEETTQEKEEEEEKEKVKEEEKEKVKEDEKEKVEEEKEKEKVKDEEKEKVKEEESGEGKKKEVVKGKKESPSAYNDVIASKMQENPRKNKVLALAGAFQTVIDYETAASK